MREIEREREREKERERHIGETERVCEERGEITSETGRGKSEQRVTVK